MEKTILIPTNFSKPAWNALVYAIELFQQSKVEFYILNTYKKDLLNLNSEEAKSKSETGLQKILNGIQFRDRNTSHSFHTISTSKKLEQAIEEVIREKNINMIVLGSKGKYAGINSAYDSTVSSISQNINDCPVLVIPETLGFELKNFTEIVFPTSLLNKFLKKDLQILIDLAKKLKAPIRIVNVEESKEEGEIDMEMKNQLMDIFKELKISFHTLTQTTVSTGVHIFIQSRNSSMLALYKRRQGFFSRLFMQNFKKDIDFDPMIPVLLIPELENKN
ncbi:universal stress protein [Salegentibacter sp. HM20]